MAVLRLSRPLVPALGAVIVLVAQPAAAADQPASEPDMSIPITITATRLPIPVVEAGSSVTVITAEEIQQKQERTLPDVLRDVPGLTVVSTGGPGGQTSVFMRGTNSNHTKILIDGIDAGDPTTTGGAFDFAHLLTFDIERVEVLRGPQSGLYGADAIGGVINVVTRRGEGELRLSSSIEGGSYGTFNQSGAARGATGPLSYAFDVGHYSALDTPVTPPELLPPGRKAIGDAYDNKTFAAKLGLAAADNLDFGLTARYIDTDLRFTGQDFSSFPSTPAANQSDSQTRQFFTRGNAHWVLFDGLFEQNMGFAYTDYRRRDLTGDTGFGPTPPNYNRGDRIKADWRGDFKIMPGHILTLGAEHQIEQIRDSPISAQTSTDSGFAQLQSAVAERLFNTLSVRYDGSDRFVGSTTYRVAPSLLVPETATRLKGSVGTGFKGPTLQQLFVSFPSFNFFANPNLKPEESFGYDFGFEQSVPWAPIRFGSTYFHNDIDNLITANATFTSFANIARAETYGAENFIAFEPWAGLSFRGDYTYTMANDTVLHQQLLRRPKHKASLNAAWQADPATRLTATLLYIGARVDGNRDFSIPRLKAGGYPVVNLAGTYDFGNGVGAFARIDNALDRRIQDPTGFLRPGLSAFGGIKIAFDSGAFSR